MAVKDYTIESNERSVKRVGLINSFKHYLAERGEGLNLIQKIMLTLYSLMTIFLLFSVLIFVIMKGMKY